MNTIAISNTVGGGWILRILDSQEVVLATYLQADYESQDSAATQAVTDGYIFLWQITGTPTVVEYTLGWTIEEWDARYNEVFMLDIVGFHDILAVRAQILTLVSIVAGNDPTIWSNGSGWGTLSAVQKHIACKWFPDLVPIALLFAAIPLIQRKPLVKAYIAMTQVAYATRLEAVETVIFTTMPLISRHQLMRDTNLLIDLYLKAGILTNAADGVDGIGDYLASTSSYSGAGFVEAGYTVNAGLTLSAIATSALNIFAGNY